ncbi:hypothetical protein [Rhizosaccharibacter radicis]|uniref:Uncharacterized protein n=1 Tax=Rhizosaccharibacter radicis TaxID=2782605 RepID=A0ABT1VUV0_9PROT|nr:hypothetical protein [Acetobacteraceae bacterium KSS12]
MREPPVHVSSDEVHAHPRHTGHRGIDLFLALTAVFISAISLYVAIEHGRTERDLVAANSWPYLQYEGTGTPEQLSMSMENAGIGPAKVNTIQLMLDNKPVPDTMTLFERCCGVTPEEWKNMKVPNSLASMSVLRPGENRVLLDVTPAMVPAPVFLRLRSRWRDLHLRTCYCSVFDECWMSNMEDLSPKPVRRCDISEPSFNQDLLTPPSSSPPG